MKLITALISTLTITTITSLAPSNIKNKHQLNRRDSLISITAATTTLLSTLTPPPPAFAAQGAEAFVGTFSDPINHPGGTRTIRLLDEQQKVGDYQLAEVQGGGGIGEPKHYVLPAVVLGGRTIVIDFSPKGGPRDFVGVLEKGDIKFLRDGNRWPRLN